MILPQSGPIQFAIPEEHIQRSTNADGSIVASCDDAESQIEAMRGKLQENFGIAMSSLLSRWCPVVRDPWVPAGRRGRHDAVRANKTPRPAAPTVFSRFERTVCC